MEKSDRKFSQVSGLIMILSAFGIIALHILEKNPFDSYIMPFILLMCGMVFLLRKSEKKQRDLRLGKKQKGIVITTLSISLVGGIIVMLLTLL